MASTNKTSLGLNMWEASDKPVRQDFVNDNVIVDAKISELNSSLDKGIAKLNSDLAIKYKALSVTPNFSICGNSYSVSTDRWVYFHLGFSTRTLVLSGNDITQVIDTGSIVATNNIAISSLSGVVYVFKASGTNLQAESEIPAGTTFILDVLLPLAK